MRRLIDNVIFEWIQRPTRRPLFLYGAPRCGKSEILQEVGRSTFAQRYYVIDCAKDEDLDRLFGSNENVGGFLGVFQKRVGKPLDFNRTFIIIDNIQAYPSALKTIRDLCAKQKELYIAFAGNLEQHLLRVHPWIVESFQLHRVYPLSFSEYLEAVGEPELSEIVMGQLRDVPLGTHCELVEHMNDYLVVGGMPEVVAAWSKRMPLPEIRELQQKLINSLCFMKGEDVPFEEQLPEIVKRLAAKAGTPIDYQALDGKLPQSTVKRILDFLQERGIVQKVVASTPTTMPELQSKVKRFKSIFIDVGLMSVASGFAEQLDGDSPPRELEAIQQALHDQFIGQELILAQGNGVRFWASSVKDSTATVNYLIPNGVVAKPAVVETQDMSAVNASLDICLGSYPECKEALVLGNNRYDPDAKAKLRDYPLYFSMALAGGFKSLALTPE